jgi:hypothetical protein
MPSMPKGTGSILAMAWNRGGVHGKFAKVQSGTLQFGSVEEAFGPLGWSV